MNAMYPGPVVSNEPAAALSTTRRSPSKSRPCSEGRSTNRPCASSHAASSTPVAGAVSRASMKSAANSTAARPMSSIDSRSGSSGRPSIIVSLSGLASPTTSPALVVSVGSVGLTPVDRVTGAVVVLGERLHLGRDLRGRPVAVDRPTGVGRDANGNRCKREPVDLFATIGHLDIAMFDVFGVVKIGYAIVPQPDDVLSKRLRDQRLNDYHEVVAADMPQKRIIATVPRHGFRCTAGEQLDCFIASEEPIVIVEGLEVVQIDVHQRERSAGGNTTRHFLLDLNVAWKLRQRIRVAHFA